MQRRCPDVVAVREQLRLLGHAVEDSVIADFVQGLATGEGGPRARGGDDGGGGLDQGLRADSGAPAKRAVPGGATAGAELARPAATPHRDAAMSPDAVAARSPDRRSQQVVLTRSARGQSRGCGGAAAAAKVQRAADSSSSGDDAGCSSTGSSPARRAALDARCRSFLARLAARSPIALSGPRTAVCDSSESVEDGQPALVRAGAEAQPLMIGDSGCTAAAAPARTAAGPQGRGGFENSANQGTAADLRSPAVRLRPSQYATAGDSGSDIGSDSGDSDSGAQLNASAVGPSSGAAMEDGSARLRAARQHPRLPEWYRPVSSLPALDAMDTAPASAKTAARPTLSVQPPPPPRGPPVAGHSPTSAFGNMWATARSLGPLQQFEVSIIEGGGLGSSAAHPHAATRGDDPLFRAPNSPTPSAASAGHAAPLAPPVSPVSPVPPMRRSAAAVRGGATLQPVGGCGRRRSIQPQEPHGAAPRTQRGAPPAAAALLRQHQDAPARDKYARLALIEAGWNPADAAAAHPTCAQPDKRPASAGGGPRAPPASASALRRGSSASGSSRPVLGGSHGPPRHPKTDRVSRYRELQEQWTRDRFLRSGAGGASSDARRPLVGFSGYYAAAHAEAEEQRRAALASGRARGM